MNDTPETEAAVIASGGDWSPVLRETCRRLERERNEVNEELSKKYVEFDKLFHEAEQIRIERDEAREKLDEEMKWHHRTHQELVEAQCKLLDIEYDKLKS